jgi:hypothetical protein
MFATARASQGGARPEAKLGGAQISRCILPLRELLLSHSTRRAAPGQETAKQGGNGGIARGLMAAVTRP